MGWCPTHQNTSNYGCSPDKFKAEFEIWHAARRRKSFLYSSSYGIAQLYRTLAFSRSRLAAYGGRDYSPPARCRVAPVLALLWHSRSRAGHFRGDIFILLLM